MVTILSRTVVKKGRKERVVTGEGAHSKEGPPLQEVSSQGCGSRRGGLRQGMHHIQNVECE